MNNNDYIKETHMHWIAENLLLNYGFWDDSTIFKESFYKYNNIKFHIDINNYALAIFGTNNAYKNDKDKTDIDLQIDDFLRWKESMLVKASNANILIDILLLKIDNSKQITLLLSPSDNSTMTTYEFASMAAIDYAQNMKSYWFLKYSSGSYVDGFCGYDQLPLAYKKARYLNDLVFFNVNKTLITEHDAVNETLLDNDNLFFSQCTKWINLLYFGASDKLIEMTNKILNSIQKHQSFSNFRYFEKLITTNINIIASVYSIKFNAPKPFDFKNYFTINDYRKTIIDCIKPFKDQLTNIYSINCTLAMYYIQTNYKNSDLTINDIADYIGISNTYLSSEFKKELNIPLLQFIQSYRLYKAKELLGNTNLAYNEIAKAVGYDSYELFRKHFKTHFNTSPSHYRDTLIKE